MYKKVLAWLALVCLTGVCVEGNLFFQELQGPYIIRVKGLKGLKDLVDLKRIKGSKPNEGIEKYRTAYHRYADNVYFKLWNRGVSEPEVVVFNKVKYPKFKKFDPKKKTVILIHGNSDPYIAEYVHSYFYVLRGAFLKSNDYNVIGVDWTKLARSNGKALMRKATFVGEHIANLIKYLRKLYRKKIKGFHIVAHHYGTVPAAVAGFSLRKQKLDRIMGLAPPKLKRSYLNKKVLKKSHAKVVEIIHTYGQMKATAHRDFYPNGGLTQPDCIWDVNGKCSIRKAYEYYAVDTYLNGAIYRARKCKSYKDFLYKKCKRGTRVSLYNKFSAKEKPIGKYYLIPKVIPSNVVQQLPKYIKKK